MAMTPAEKQKAYRDRKRKEQMKAKDGTSDYLEKTFSELWNASAGFTDFEMSLELAGIEPPTFEDERDPDEAVLNREAIGVDLYGREAVFGDRKGAIGRAELTINCLIDAAIELARIVNAYKQREVQVQLDKLTSGDGASNADAFAEAVRLNKILEQLDKEVRRSFPVWEVKGV